MSGYNKLEGIFIGYLVTLGIFSIYSREMMILSFILNGATLIALLIELMTE